MDAAYCPFQTRRFFPAGMTTDSSSVRHSNCDEAGCAKCLFLLPGNRLPREV